MKRSEPRCVSFLSRKIRGVDSFFGVVNSQISKDTPQASMVFSSPFHDSIVVALPYIQKNCISGHLYPVPIFIIGLNIQIFASK